jgi:ABC-type xylose transport system permease subunit
MRFKNKKDKKEHWLDHAEDKFSSKLINDTKLALNILVMFIPLLLFWALFDQQVRKSTFLTPRYLSRMCKTTSHAPRVQCPQMGDFFRVCQIEI